VTADRPLRTLPPVSAVLRSREGEALLSRFPREEVLAAARRVLGRLRADASRAPEVPREEWTARLLALLPFEVAAGRTPSLRPVINAAGVVVHTNLGRSPLAEEALDEVVRACAGYSNLELDLATGERSSRLVHVEEALTALSGAEAVHVVNNNAAAVFLCLSSLSRGREAIVSRGELVEIGGSFRIPDVMAESGARMVEVGTTNRTRLSDYERAVTAETALLLKVHRSNFRIEGFTGETSVAELASLGRARAIPVLEDLGAGALFDFAPEGFSTAPTLASSIAAGADLVTASGDKLLGGPQAGIVAGRRDLVDRIRRHPLSRALRVDKLCLAALSATLALYADRRLAAERVPVLRMLLEPAPSVRRRAARLLRAVRRGAAGAGATAAVVPALSSPGGGSLPGVTLPSWALSVQPSRTSPEALEERLRLGSPPVLGRLHGGALVLDLRTVGEGEVAPLAAALLSALAPPAAGAGT
jgi:L-seryl-tRNA(Ser) seleniumtransferase